MMSFYALATLRRRAVRAPLAVVAALAAALALPATGRAAVSIGGWMAHSPDDISGFTTLAGNDAVGNIALPFTFTVEGVGYNAIALSTNGWIEFGGNTAGDSDPSNDCLPTGAHTNPFFAFYWDDLNPFGTGVRHGTVGTAPNRVFIVDVQADLNIGEGADDFGVQVQLHEGSNLITVRYRESQDVANGQLATIGFQGAGGAAATTVQPIVCNGKVLDDNRPDEGWSADVGRAGQVTLAAMLAHSPDDLPGGFATITNNDQVAAVGLPFNVTIEGVTYNSIALSSNGWIEFGTNTSGNSDPTNDCLPTGAHTNPLLAAYWDDLDPFGTELRYGTVGTAPNRVFIADYEVDLTSGNEGSDDLRFQVQIHERSSLINVRYRDKQTNATGSAATIGFQGAGGASAKTYGITCNAKILDDNDEQKDGWSIHPKASGAMSPHGVIAYSPDDITVGNIPGLQSFNGDDQVQTAILPFTLTLDGVGYTNVAISTNGWLEFGGNTSGNSDPTNDCLPTSAHTNPFLAAFWDDMLTAGSSNVRYGTVGSSPNRTFLVDYFLDTKTSGDDGNDDVEVQVQIHESSNAVLVKYREAQLLAGGQTATIGFQSAGGASATARPITCNGRVLDDNRNDVGWSIAPLPICGDGISESLGNEQCDQGGANGSATSCCTAACGFRSGGSTCRVGGGAPCDLNETCTGSAGTCPADDAPSNTGITCRIGSGDPCDPDELCNGMAGVACPADVVASNATVCRTGGGDLCDPAETCPGVAGQTCPANVVAPASTVCRTGSGDICDAHETCPGIPGGTCPADDAPFNAGNVCRSGSGDVCDANETCTGSSGVPCPPDDAAGNAGVVCRPSSVHGAFCDDNEVCTGVPGSTCPPNDAPSKVNVVCRTGSGDSCDPDERCSGLSGQGCPADVVANPTTVCRTGSGDSCDPDETCTAIPGQTCPADVVTPAGTECRAANGSCDVAETCSGTGGQACPADAFVGAGTTCDLDGNLCTEDTCDGSGACLTSGALECDDGNLCTQDSCDPILGCQISGAPATTCLPGVKAKLQIKDSASNDNGDRLKFDWKGGPVTLAHLGNPLVDTRYELCLYDDSGIEGAIGVPPGAGWAFLGSATSPKGYKYKDRFGVQAGVGQITLKASSLDKAKLKLVAKGGPLPDGLLPLQANVTAQLHAGDGVCWEAEFGPAETKRSDAGIFSGKTPAP